MAHLASFLTWMYASRGRDPHTPEAVIPEPLKERFQLTEDTP